MGIHQQNYVNDMVRFGAATAAEAAQEFREDFGGFFNDEDEEPWTDEDEAGLEQFEEDRRRRIAEQNEY